MKTTGTNAEGTGEERGGKALTSGRNDNTRARKGRKVEREGSGRQEVREGADGEK